MGYNSFPGPDSKIQVAVVASDDQDCAEDHSCNQRLYSPLDHGDEVDLQHLNFSSMSINPSQMGQQAFAGIMDPGTPVFVLKQLGMPGGIVLGQSNTVKKGGQGAGGGSGGLGSSNKVRQLSAKELNISVPPDIEEAEEDGVKIRKIKEKGKNHKLDLLDGLPMHGALFDMAGFRLPEIKAVPTAKQTNDQMMTGQMMQQMLGQVMSMGQMFQGLMGRGGGGGGGGGGIGSGAQLTGGGALPYGGGLGNNSIQAIDAAPGTQMHTIMQGLSPQMQSAVNSLSVLVQGLETTNGVAYFTGGAVHEETYLNNAQQLLSKVQTLDDLMYVLQRLQWDTTLFGQDKLDNVVNQIETAWGVALQEVDVNGNIVVTYDNEAANAEASFANSMMSNTSSPGLGFSSTPSYNSTGASSNPLGTGAGAGGGGGGGSQGFQQVMGMIQGQMGGMLNNMFGEGAGTMKDMWKRMTRDQEQDAKKMHEKLNQDEDANKRQNIIKKTTEGGNPIDMEGDDFNNGTGQFSVSFM